jgi:hypothetical protein
MISVIAIVFALFTVRLGAQNIRSPADERNVNDALTHKRTMNTHYTFDAREFARQGKVNQMNRQKLQSCIAACSDCTVECRSCISECLNEQDVKMLAQCIRLNQDCAAMCMVAMEAMAGGSEFVKPICTLCATICYACAIECEIHSQVYHCTKCAEVCRKCAIECNKMSKT